MDAGPLPDGGRDDHDVLARRAAHDVARTAVDEHRADGMDRAAEGAASVGIGHLAPEDLYEHAAQCVAVDAAEKTIVESGSQPFGLFEPAEVRQWSP